MFQDNFGKGVLGIWIEFIILVVVITLIMAMVVINILIMIIVIIIIWIIIMVIIIISPPFAAHFRSQLVKTRSHQHQERKEEDF